MKREQILNTLRAFFATSLEKMKSANRFLVGSVALLAGLIALFLDEAFQIGRIEISSAFLFLALLMFISKAQPAIQRVYKIPGLAGLAGLVALGALYPILASLNSGPFILDLSPSLQFSPVWIAAIVLFFISLYTWRRKNNLRWLVLADGFALLLIVNFNPSLFAFLCLLALASSILYLWVSDNRLKLTNAAWRYVLFGLLFLYFFYHYLTFLLTIFYSASGFPPIENSFNAHLSLDILFYSLYCAVWCLYRWKRGNVLGLDKAFIWRAIVMLLAIGINFQVSLVPHPLWLLALTILDDAANYPWHLKAGVLGLLSGTLIAQLLGEIIKTLTYLFFVPGIWPAFSFEHALIPIIVAGVILFETGPLAVIWTRPANKRSALLAAGLAGLLSGGMVFINLAVPLAVIAGQRSLYGAAYSSAEFRQILEQGPFSLIGVSDYIYSLADYRNMIAPLAEAVLYLYPWVLGAFAFSLLTGLLPALLTGLCVPLKRKTTPAEESFSVYALFALLLNLVISIIVMVAASILLAPLLGNAILRAGLEVWWQPGWIVPASLGLMPLAIIVLVFSGLRKLSSLPKSAYLAMLSGLIGLSLILLAGSLWFVGPGVSLWFFPAIWAGIEFLRLAQEKWIIPVTPDEQYTEFKKNWGNETLLASFLGSLLNLPFLATSLGLVLISVAAIGQLTSITQPLGQEWLTNLLTPIFSSVSGLLLSMFFSSPLASLISAFIFSNVLPWLVEPTWFEKMLALAQKIQKWLIGSWERTKLSHLRVNFLNRGLFLTLLLALVALPIAYNLPLVYSFLVIYAYFKFQPQRFRSLGNRGLILAGIAAIAGLALLFFRVAADFSLLGSILAGLSFAILYRALVVYTPSPYRQIANFLFFVGLWGLLALSNNYQALVTRVESGVARYKNQTWEVYNRTNSPLSDQQKYSLFHDADNQIWLVNYVGIDAFFADEHWNEAKLLGEWLSETQLENVTSLSSGQMLFDGQSYWYIGNQTIRRIVTTKDGYQFVTPSRPKTDLPVEQQGTSLSEDNPVSEATTCPTLTNLGENDECPNWGSITTVVSDHQGGLWVGSQERGLWHLIMQEPQGAFDWKVLTPQKNHLSSNSISAIILDDDNQLWVISDQGVDLLKDGEVTQSTSWTDIGLSGIPQAAYRDRLGRIWVGTSENIAVWVDAEWKLLPPAQTTTATWGFYETNRNEIWALTSLGAIKNQGLTWSTPISIPADPLWENPFGPQTFYQMEPPATGVRVMAEDSAGNLWFGGPRGLLKFSPSSGETQFFYPSNSGLPSEDVRDLQVDRDGGVWVSTFTVSTARQSELPVFGFGAFFVVLIFLMANAGYQRSPQKLAAQSYARLIDKPDNLLSEAHLLSQGEHAGEVLNYLTSSFSSEPIISRLLNAYQHLVTQTTEISKTLFAELVETINALPRIADSQAIKLIYTSLRQAAEIHSAAEIAQWELKIVRSQSGQPPLMTLPGQPPLEIPGWLDVNTIDSLETLGQSTGFLKKYLQVDSSQDKLSYIADALRTVEMARRLANLAQLPEKPLLLFVANAWLDKINQEINLLSGHADLRVEFRTRQVRRAPRMTMLLSIRNVGRAPAENIRISLLADEAYQVLPGSELTVEKLGTAEVLELQWLISAQPVKEIRIAGIIFWDDRILADNQLQFADLIKLYELTEHFERITPNPFEVGKPIKSASLFYGREDIFKFITQNLQGVAQSRTLVLHGQRRTGKTSILYQLVNGRLGVGFIPVLIDVQELALAINSTADLFIEMADKIVRAAKKAGFSLTAVEDAALQAAPTRAFNRFLDEVEAHLPDQKLVLMFDEFELLEQKIDQQKLDADVLGYIRSLIQHRDHLAFIFTGTHKLEQMSKDYWSIFFNIALHEQVSFMGRQETEQLIRGPVQGRLSLDDLAVEKIMNLTNCHPYFVQLLCYKLVDHCNRQERNYATINDVNDVVNDVVTSGEAHFAYFWQSITTAEKFVLTAIAESLSPGRNMVTLTEISELIVNAGISQFEKQVLLSVLDNLTSQDILVLHTGGVMQYSYRIGLIAEWVKKSKTLRILAERGL